LQERNEESLNEILAKGVPDTPLGQAVANLHASWAQLICNLSARTGSLPPTLEHIKEVAECAIRQLKDSSHDLTKEFARVGVEWRLTHPQEALVEMSDSERLLCVLLQLKDSSHDLTKEFARVGVEWRLTHPQEALVEDIADLEQGITRQETLIGRASGIIQRRLGDLANETCTQEFD
uniref:PLU-1 domain-containing protein n=1 Tax=Gongylonema pulchrum TaxID=637853 RepID=A0A183E565_9BILA